jgi:hypothetical protein
MCGFYTGDVDFCANNRDVGNKLHTFSCIYMCVCVCVSDSWVHIEITNHKEVFVILCKVMAVQTLLFAGGTIGLQYRLREYS